MLVVRCAAKVNWILKVGPRRADGYHELWTLFQTIGLHDELRLTPSAKLELACDDPRVPTGEENTVWRVAAALRERFAVQQAVRIELRKRIPPGSGLGGGSSDAAGALLALERMWGLSLTREHRQAIAAEVGADVPFFLVGGTAVGTGRGDCLEPGPAWEVPWMLLGLPPFVVSTAEVYRRWDRRAERLTAPGARVSLSGLSERNSPPAKDFRLLANDLEPVIFEGWPQVREFRDALVDSGAEVALVSGSGGAVFGVFGGPSARARAEALLAGRFHDWKLVPCGTQPVAIEWASP